MNTIFTVSYKVVLERQLPFRLLILQEFLVIINYNPEFVLNSDEMVLNAVFLRSSLLMVHKLCKKRKI